MRGLAMNPRLYRIARACRIISGLPGCSAYRRGGGRKSPGNCARSHERYEVAVPPPRRKRNELIFVGTARVLARIAAGERNSGRVGRDPGKYARTDWPGNRTSQFVFL